MSGGDEERLLGLLTHHRAYTGSDPRPARSSTAGPAYRPKFVKVMPVEYRRAIREMGRDRLPQAAE